MKVDLKIWEMRKEFEKMGYDNDFINSTDWVVGYSVALRLINNKLKV